VVVYFKSKRPCYVGSRPGLCLEVFLNLAGNDALNRLGGHAEIFDLAERADSEQRRGDK
jgi:hypothetical protein